MTKSVRSERVRKWLSELVYEWVSKVEKCEVNSKGSKANTTTITVGDEREDCDECEVGNDEGRRL